MNYNGITKDHQKMAKNYGGWDSLCINNNLDKIKSELVSQGKMKSETDSKVYKRYCKSTFIQRTNEKKTNKRMESKIFSKIHIYVSL